jgi:hypothetical protein
VRSKYAPIGFYVGLGLTCYALVQLRVWPGVAQALSGIDAHAMFELSLSYVSERAPLVLLGVCSAAIALVAGHDEGVLAMEPPSARAFRGPQLRQLDVANCVEMRSGPEIVWDPARGLLFSGISIGPHAPRNGKRSGVGLSPRSPRATSRA